MKPNHTTLTGCTRASRPCNAAPAQRYAYVAPTHRVLRGPRNPHGTEYVALMLAHLALHPEHLGDNETPPPEPRTVSLPCKWCGKMFEKRMDRKNKGRKYCSPECTEKAYRENLRRHSRKHYHQEKSNEAR